MQTCTGIGPTAHGQPFHPIDGGLMTFASLGLPPVILKGIRAAGLSDPTAIQSKAIPTILQGNDLIGVAPSGSGKTGAYLIPILARLLDSSTRLRCLMLVPTRELAAYVETRCRDYARYTEIKVGVVFTGGPLPAQERMLRGQDVDILVATPGRLLELLERKAVNFEYIEVLVLEEADRMVSMGMGPELRRLLKLLPETRQTLMFTMSLPPELNRLAKEALIEPVRVDLAPPARPGSGIRQVIYPVPRDLKPDFLNHMLTDRELWGGSDVRGLVLFTRGRYGADRLARMLHRRNYVTAVLDDYPSQQEREQALQELHRGRTQILVASDGAGRSLDLSGVSHVVNYDVPQTPEDYAHRLGRPGRPDAPGNMFTLMSPEEQKDIAGIERLLGRTIERSFLPAFDYGMRPSEIKQVLSYDDEWTRPRRTVAGLQTAAARIAGAPVARPAPPARAAQPAVPPGAVRHGVASPVSLTQHAGVAGAGKKPASLAARAASPSRKPDRGARPPRGKPKRAAGHTKRKPARRSPRHALAARKRVAARKRPAAPARRRAGVRKGRATPARKRAAKRKGRVPVSKQKRRTPLKRARSQKGGRAPARRRVGARLKRTALSKKRKARARGRAPRVRRKAKKAASRRRARR
jgi:ATP-dependent RNA helicase RhlE